MSAAQNASEIVVMLHGLGRTPLSMLGASLWFKKAGYEVASIAYPSRRVGVEVAVRDFVAPEIENLLASRPVKKLHFVTHSLGGIVFRWWAALHAEKLPMGRGGGFGPPNKRRGVCDPLVD
jgi:triacylglycerol esterase/lipase EstA (alpha/beta hydrolase family)